MRGEPLSRCGTVSWIGGLAGFIVGVVAFACAVRDSETPERLSALEARLSRIEAALTPDASVPSPELNQDAAPPTYSDGGDDASSPLVVLASEPEPEWLVLCLARVEESCREAAKDGGLSWEEPPAASATPRGRACLEQKRSTCDRERGRLGRGERVRQWLDAQLVAEKIDAPYTRAVRARIDSEIARLGDALDFACTAQFCRMTLKPGEYPAKLLLVPTFVDGGGAMERPSTGVFYMRRKSFRFPE